MKKAILILITVVLSILCLNAVSADESDFVYRNGDHLELNGEPFYFNSANNDHLYYSTDFMINDILNDTKGLGLVAFRTWASSEGETSWKEDGEGNRYCFQPHRPLSPTDYHEPTFRRMDYIIAKAGEKGIRLVLPFVNNWDDYFGGMVQYTKWSVSAKSDLKLSLYNPGSSCQVAIAVRTGNWDWYEAPMRTLDNGWNELSEYLQSPVWMCAANGWTYSSPVANLDNALQLDIVVYTSNGLGSIYLDNIRLGPSGHPILWDRAEELDNEPLHSPTYGLWRPETGNAATGVSVDSLYHVEGEHSLKLDFNPALPGGKAIWKKDTLMGNHDVFYFDNDCKAMYKNYIAYMLDRTNSITDPGIKYKDDPTIIMWELANEPRCESDPSGDTLQTWIEEMSGYIKNIDPDHLICTGGEGWYSIPGSTNWRYNGQLGADYIRNSNSPYIDVCSFHLYPEGYGMSDSETLDWITEHIEDAKNAIVIGKPVYMGEFGLRVYRNASRSAESLLHDFTQNSEGWFNQWGYNGNPIRVAEPSFNGNGAIKYNGNFWNDSNAGGSVWYNSPIDLSGYQYISAWVRTPNVPQGTWLQLQLYTKSGPANKETWGSDFTQGYLAPESWYQIKMAVSEMVYPADPANIKAIGVQIKSWNTSYSGDVYYDLVEAYTGSDSSASTQMDVRNRTYGDWYNAVKSRSGDSAGFWQLLGRRDDGSLFPDYWNWGIYFPEDSATCEIITGFSAWANDKWIVKVPASCEINEGETLQFNISSTDTRNTSLRFTASSLPSGATFTDNLNGTGNFTWTPAYNQAGNYSVHFEIQNGSFTYTRDVSITVNNVLVFGNIYTSVSGQVTPLEGATVSVIDIARTKTFLATTTDALGSFSIVGSLPDGNYIVKTTKESYNTYSGITVLRNSQALPFTATLYAPVMAALQNVSSKENDPVNISASATDTNKDKLTFKAVNLPQGASFIDNNNGTASFNWNPTPRQAGTYTVRFEVTDGYLKDSKDVGISVENVLFKGRALDQLGNTVPGATVKIWKISLWLRRTKKYTVISQRQTDSTGAFSFNDNLPRAAYLVTCEKSGYNRYTQEILLDPNLLTQKDIIIRKLGRR